MLLLREREKKRKPKDPWFGPRPGQSLKNVASAMLNIIVTATRNKKTVINNDNYYNGSSAVPRMRSRNTIQATSHMKFA